MVSVMHQNTVQLKLAIVINLMEFLLRMKFSLLPAR